MEDGFIFCYECEEYPNCSDAERMDGCELGIKTIINEDEEKK